MTATVISVEKSSQHSRLFIINLYSFLFPNRTQPEPETQNRRPA